MSRTIPVIALRGTLIVSVQVELSDHLVTELKESVAQEIRYRDDVTGLVIEVSGVDVFDSYIARSIEVLARLARLMGVRTVLAGLDSGMAITLVEMGMSLEGVDTALNLEDALNHLDTLRDEEPVPSSRPPPNDDAGQLEDEDW